VDRDSRRGWVCRKWQIDNALGDAFAQAQVSNIYNPFSPQAIPCRHGSGAAILQNPEILKELYVSTAGGAASGTQLTQAVSGHHGAQACDGCIPDFGGAGRRAQPVVEFPGECKEGAIPQRDRRSASRRKPSCRSRHSAISPPDPPRYRSITPARRCRHPLPTICRGVIDRHRTGLRSPRKLVDIHMPVGIRAALRHRQAVSTKQ